MCQTICRNIWLKRITVCLAVGMILQTLPMDTQAQAQSPPSIQARIDQAPAGSQVVIEPGVYKETLRITKPLQLISKGATIDGGGKGHVIDIAADQVRIEGFTIRNSGRQLHDAGIHLTGKDCEILRNQFLQVKLGIFLEDARAVRISGNRVQSSGEQMAKRGNGIHLLRSDQNQIVQNTFHHVQDGVYLESSNDNLVKQNSVDGSRYAIHMMTAARNHFEENRLTENVIGLMSMSASDNRFTGNEIKEHLGYQGYGILAYQSKGLQVTDNSIQDNHVGIMLEETTGLTLADNLVAGNSVGLELNQKNQGNVYVRNQFIGNVVQAKLPDHGQQTAINGPNEGNYWDDYQGLDLNEDGLGDVAYQAGASFDTLVERKPQLQLFFESPAVRILGATEKIVPTRETGRIHDDFPLLSPARHEEQGTRHGYAFDLRYLAAGLLLVGSSMVLLRLGRRVT